MSFIRIVNTLRLYGADVLLLALGATLVTSLLKKTVLKNCSGKLIVFLPFAAGLVLYGLFRAAATCSAAPFTCEIAETLDGGFSCGCASTLYYSIYKEFRGEHVPILYPLLEAVPEERRREVAERLYLDATALPEAEREAYFLAALESDAPDLTDEERRALALLLTEFLQKLS